MDKVSAPKTTQRTNVVPYSRDKTRSLVPCPHTVPSLHSPQIPAPAILEMLTASLDFFRFGIDEVDVYCPL